MTDRRTAPEPLLASLENEIHLWLTPLSESAGPEEAWRRYLSPEEEAANRRFRVESPRRQHLAARGLVRITLSRYVAVDPRSWRFRLGPDGRPEIDGPDGLPALRFNLSHTDGLVACAVTLGFDSGVDVERPGRRVRDPLRLAEHSFSPAELSALERLGGVALQQRFFDLWTLKEAYVKALGAGFLSLPARRFAYRIDDGIIRMTIEPDLGDDPGDWQTMLLAPEPGYRLALAVRRGRRPDLSLAAWQVEPAAEPPRPVRPEIVARSLPPARAGAALGGAGGT